MTLARRSFLGLTAAAAAGLLRRPSGAGTSSRPINLLLILTDNQGAWTLGCYGNPDIRTPNIDRLATEGVRFTRAFSCNAVCSPTRASLLTGLIPSQHGVHTYLSAGGAQTGPKAYCTIAEFPSLPKILGRAGYTCGLVGKWHLGGNLTPQEGFSYWVTMPHGHTTTFYDAEIIENGKVRREPEYLTGFWTRHAVRFLEQNRDRPFFLYLAYNGPYGLGKSMAEPARNRHAAYYADKSLPSFPRLPVHPWLVHNREYINTDTAIRRMAAEVSGVDDGVGVVMAALKRLNLDATTVVVFLADQGWSGGHHGIWGMADHTRPLNAFDETMHIPLIIRHAGAIGAGRECDRMVCTYDVAPTLVSYLGLGQSGAHFPQSPGRDASPLLGGGEAEWEDVIFYEFLNTRVVRTPEWKLVRRHPDGPDELYDLRKDPGETTNLIAASDMAAIRRTLQRRLDDFFDRYADPKYDVWKGGSSREGCALLKMK